MSQQVEVLVAIMNNQRDMAIALTQHWYRIPAEQVEKRLKKRWPPAWLAFYQTKEFGEESHSIIYFSEIQGIKLVKRRELFLDEEDNEKSEIFYYKLELLDLQKVPKPICSSGWKRVLFIQTTYDKLMNASLTSDL
jgi:hypothetical protein